MSLIKRMRRQSAVYWESTGYDSSGNEVFALPVEIKCRWEVEVTQSYPIEGKDSTFTNTVYVDRPCPVGGRLRKGTLEELDYPLPPPDDAQRILVAEEIPDLKCRKTLYIAKF